VGIKRQPIILALLTFRDMQYNPVIVEIAKIINPKNPETPNITRHSIPSINQEKKE
jgi:hypothetical protein